MVTVALWEASTSARPTCFCVAVLLTATVIRSFSAPSSLPAGSSLLAPRVLGPRSSKPLSRLVK